jgi:creatinine amidohydrolase
MARAAKNLLGELTSLEISQRQSKTSILCLPLGSIEQHGPHLPLNTDTVLAEAFTQRIVARWGKSFDLWQLPPWSLGLSREHAWAPGTISLSIQSMTALLRELGGEIARALPARNLAIINGHGGNRGLLDVLVRELAADFGLNVCALHLGAMMSPVSDASCTEIHAGKDETSVMLALAPHLVRKGAAKKIKPAKNAMMIRTLILDPNTSWPWTSDDPRIAVSGVIGDAHLASAKHGQAIVDRVVGAVGAVFKQLIDNQRRSQRKT